MSLADYNEDAKSMLIEHQNHCDCASKHNNNLKSKRSRKSNESPDKEITAFHDFGHSPCRKTCSTIHNPIYHIPRFGMEITAEGVKANSDGRFIDKFGKLKEEVAMWQLDWMESELGEEIKQRASKTRQKSPTARTSPSKARKEDPIMSHVEVQHMYKQLKDESIRKELTSDQLESMLKRTWSTLQSLMSKLMLNQEFQ